MLDEISRSRRDQNRPANNFLSSLDDVSLLPPIPTDLSTGGGRDVRNLNTDPLESPSTSAGSTTVAPPPAPRIASPSSVGGDAGTDADPASGVAPGPSLDSVDFSGIAAGRGAVTGFGIAGVPGAIAGGFLGGVFGGGDSVESGAESLGAEVGENAAALGASDGALGGAGIGDLSSGIGVGGGDGGDGPSVICTELNRRGLMSDELYWADQMNVASVPENTVHGYHAWAVPYVRLMRNRWVGWAATEFIRPFAIAWAEHHTGIRPNVGGWLLKHLGQPVCWALGAVTGIIDISVLYKGDDHA